MNQVSQKALIGLFLVTKLIIHLCTMSNYGLHRDEYLYLEEGRRMSWGFMEVPPMTPFLGWLSQLFGDGTFAVRIFPVLCGIGIMWLVFRMIQIIGGGRAAIAFSGVGMLIAPAFSRSHAFLMPVVLEQLMWTLLAFWTLKIITTEEKKYWLAFGITLGLAWLTKYSIVFFGTSIFIGVLLTPHRKFLTSPYPYLALGLALLIASPNIFWQINHNLPVLHHMEDLSATQLTNVQPIRFLTDQLLMLGLSSVVWIAGLLGLFLNKKLKPYRLFGLIYLSVLLLFLILNGKSYYTLGAYPMLMAFGGFHLATIFTKKSQRIGIIAAMTILSLPLIPFGASVLPMEYMKSYCAFMSEKVGLKDVLYWEDGELHELPQDFADMTGWEEIPEKVAKFYHSLPPDEKENTIILAGHYGQAGVLNLRAEQYGLPEVQSFNSSYRIWQRTDTPFRNMILVDDRFSMESDWYETVILVDSIADENARDPGYIFYRKDPKIDVTAEYNRLVEEWRMEFNFTGSEN